tara:strand:+ start:824 stop:997 length:174 start_codon:yes stop_codon:yes gene_type:complete
MKGFLIYVVAGAYLLGYAIYFIKLSSEFIAAKGFFAYLLFGEIIVGLKAFFWPFFLL